MARRLTAESYLGIDPLSNRHYRRDDVTPGIVHIGVGNFHRAHQAAYLDRLLMQQRSQDFGITGVNLRSSDARLVKASKGQDHYYTLLERRPDGSTDARVIGSIVDHLWAPTDREAILGRLADPTTKIVSLTITEGGYCYDQASGAIDLQDTGLQHDLRHPRSPVTAFGFITEALRRRREDRLRPFTVLSCDNIVGNGDVAGRGVLAFAAELDDSLARWIQANVTFPSSMVDRITPRSRERDRADAEAATGLADDWPVSCESFSQWVVEDSFAAGRPDWEPVGVQMVPDVMPYELMKLRMINAGHQTIAYAGRLLGHSRVWEAAQDDTIRALLERYLRTQAIPTLPPVPGIDLERYGQEVLLRFSNPQIEDSIERLCGESSTMLSTFVLPVARDLVATRSDVGIVAAVVACWARFLDGTDDTARRFEIVDSRLDDLQRRVLGHRDDPLALLRHNPLFAGLDDAPHFTSAYLHALHLIRRDGARAALKQVLSSQGP